MDNVPRSRSPTRDKCDWGIHIAQQLGGGIVKLYIPQGHVVCYPNQLHDACILVSPPVGSHDVCDRITYDLIILIMVT